MRFNIIEIDVCEVCLMLCANGEYDDGENTARDCARGQYEKWGDNAAHFTCGGEELGYSTSECEGCGNPYHGDRYRLNVMIPLDTIRTGSNGRTYVSSRDGAYTEVWQGTEYIGSILKGHRRMYRATRTWADGYGRWHATVPTSGNPLRDANKARRLIIAELAQREGPAFEARAVHVTRNDFSHQDKVVEYVECA